MAKLTELEKAFRDKEHALDLVARIALARNAFKMRPDYVDDEAIFRFETIKGMLDIVHADAFHLATLWQEEYNALKQAKQPKPEPCGLAAAFDEMKQILRDGGVDLTTFGDDLLKSCSASSDRAFVRAFDDWAQDGTQMFGKPFHDMISARDTLREAMQEKGG